MEQKKQQVRRKECKDHEAYDSHLCRHPSSGLVRCPLAVSLYMCYSSCCCPKQLTATPWDQYLSLLVTASIMSFIRDLAKNGMETQPHLDESLRARLASYVSKAGLGRRSDRQQTFLNSFSSYFVVQDLDLGAESCGRAEATVHQHPQNSWPAVHFGPGEYLPQTSSWR